MKQPIFVGEIAPNRSKSLAATVRSSTTCTPQFHGNPSTNHWEKAPEIVLPPLKQKRSAGETHTMELEIIHQKLNGTESQRTPKLLELLNTQVFSGSVQRGSCWIFLGDNDVCLWQFIRFFFVGTFLVMFWDFCSLNYHSSSGNSMRFPHRCLLEILSSFQCLQLILELNRFRGGRGG